MSLDPSPAHRALVEALRPSLEALGELQVLIPAQRSSRDGLLALVGQELIFARRGLSEPELEPLGPLSELTGLAVRESFMDLELELGTRGKLRRIPLEHRDALERVVQAAAPVEAKAPSAPAPRPQPQRATLPTSAPPAPRPVAETDDASEPTPPPLLGTDREAPHTPLVSTLRALGLCAAATAVISATQMALWDIGLYTASAVLTWAIIATVGPLALGTRRRLSPAIGAGLAVGVVPELLLGFSFSAAELLPWVLLGVAWCKVREDPKWVSRGLVSAIPLVAMHSVLGFTFDVLALPYEVLLFGKLLSFWILHLSLERWRARFE